MRKLILQEFTSIDGFAADEKGSTAFFESITGSVDEDLIRFIGTIDTILLGANTYKMFAGFWPYATTDEQMVADDLNKTPKIVFSKSLAEAPWGKWEPAKIIRTDAIEAIKELKRQPGKNMVLWGSLSLAQSLLKAGVIDEVQLRVCPVSLGKGKAVFPENEALDMALATTKAYDDSGVVLLSYKLNHS